MPVGDPRTTSGVGLILKGNGHVVYANTFFNCKTHEMCIPSCIEKRKPFRLQYPLVVQNTRTQIFNTVADTDSGSGCECTGSNWTAGGNNTALLQNTSLQHLLLTDVSGMDFRPAPGSPLIDTGAVIPPYTDGAYAGKAPDIGAYEHGMGRWVAGCTHSPGC
jgi:hypothetical protein